MADQIEIRPFEGPVDAEVTVPGSKSLTNRALLVAALADGTSRIRNALDSEDTQMMVGALRRLGFEVTQEDGGAIRVTGAGGRIPVDEAELYVGNSGTTARFLTAACGLGHGRYRFDGAPRMRQRPIQDLVEGLRPLGVRIETDQANGCPPHTVYGSGIRGGTTRMSGANSSQYFTAILLVAPCAAGDVTVKVAGPLVSRPYVGMTVQVMARAGVRVAADGDRRFRVAAGQRYRAGNVSVEPDASNASYFLAAAALMGGRVRVQGLGRNSVQGDVGFVDVLAEMGCEVDVQADRLDVIGPPSLRGIDVDLNDMPDTVQTVCALAPFADGPVTVRNVANLRIKETDRLSAMAAELGKLGVRTDLREDGITVYPASGLRAAELDTYDDHRMAMSLALIGLRSPGVVIRDPGCVGKTFPTYFTVLESLRPGRAA